MKQVTANLMALTLFASVSGTALAAINTPYGPSRFALELDGQNVGWLSSVEGGDATAEVITEAARGGPLEKKHLANLLYRDLAVTLQGMPNKNLLAWVQELVGNKQRARNGAVVEVDMNGKIVSRLEFLNAVLTEVQLPGVDGSSKDVATWALVIHPETTRQQAASGNLTLPVDKAKAAISSNFRFSIAGLETATRQTYAIAPIHIAQPVVTAEVGGQRSPSSTKPVSFGALQVSLSQAAIEPVNVWFQDFVVKGNNTDERERSATLEYLSADMKTVLMTVNFKGVGIFELAKDYAPTAPRRSLANFYVEGVELK